MYPILLGRVLLSFITLLLNAYAITYLCVFAINVSIWWVLGAVIEPNHMLVYASSILTLVYMIVDFVNQMDSLRKQALDRLKTRILEAMLTMVRKSPAANLFDRFKKEKDPESADGSLEGKSEGPTITSGIILDAVGDDRDKQTQAIDFIANSVECPHAFLWLGLAVVKRDEKMIIPAVKGMLQMLDIPDNLEVISLELTKRLIGLPVSAVKISHAIYPMIPEYGSTLREYDDLIVPLIHCGLKGKLDDKVLVDSLRRVVRETLADNLGIEPLLMRRGFNIVWAAKKKDRKGVFKEATGLLQELVKQIPEDPPQIRALYLCTVEGLRLATEVTNDWYHFVDSVNVVMESLGFAQEPLYQVVLPLIKSNRSGSADRQVVQDIDLTKSGTEEFFIDIMQRLTSIIAVKFLLDSHQMNVLMILYGCVSGSSESQKSLPENLQIESLFADALDLFESSPPFDGDADKDMDDDKGKQFEKKVRAAAPLKVWLCDQWCALFDLLTLKPIRPRSDRRSHKQKFEQVKDSKIQKLADEAGIPVDSLQVVRQLCTLVQALLKTFFGDSFVPRAGASEPELWVTELIIELAEALVGDFMKLETLTRDLKEQIDRGGSTVNASKMIMSALRREIQGNGISAAQQGAQLDSKLLSQVKELDADRTKSLMAGLADSAMDAIREADDIDSAFSNGEVSQVKKLERAFTAYMRHNTPYTLEMSEESFLAMCEDDDSLFDNPFSSSSCCKFFLDKKHPEARKDFEKIFRDAAGENVTLDWFEFYPAVVQEIAQVCKEKKYSKYTEEGDVITRIIDRAPKPRPTREFETVLLDKIVPAFLEHTLSTADMAEIGKHVKKMVIWIAAEAPNGFMVKKKKKTTTNDDDDTLPLYQQVEDQDLFLDDLVDYHTTPYGIGEGEALDFNYASSLGITREVLKLFGAPNTLFRSDDHLGLETLPLLVAMTRNVELNRSGASEAVITQLLHDLGIRSDGVANAKLELLFYSRRGATMPKKATKHTTPLTLDQVAEMKNLKSTVQSLSTLEDLREKIAGESVSSDELSKLMEEEQTLQATIQESLTLGGTMTAPKKIRARLAELEKHQKALDEEELRRKQKHVKDAYLRAVELRESNFHESVITLLFDNQEDEADRGSAQRSKFTLMEVLEGCNHHKRLKRRIDRYFVKEEFKTSEPGNHCLPHSNFWNSLRPLIEHFCPLLWKDGPSLRLSKWISAKNQDETWWKNSLAEVLALHPRDRLKHAFARLNVKESPPTIDALYDILEKPSEFDDDQENNAEVDVDERVSDLATKLWTPEKSISLCNIWLCRLLVQRVCVWNPVVSTWISKMEEDDADAPGLNPSISSGEAATTKVPPHVMDSFMFLSPFELVGEKNGVIYRETFGVMAGYQPWFPRTRPEKFLAACSLAASGPHTPDHILEAVSGSLPLKYQTLAISVLRLAVGNRSASLLPISSFLDVKVSVLEDARDILLPPSVLQWYIEASKTEHSSSERHELPLDEKVLNLKWLTLTKATIDGNPYAWLLYPRDPSNNDKTREEDVIELCDQSQLMKFAFLTASGSYKDIPSTVFNIDPGELLQRQTDNNDRFVKTLPTLAAKASELVRKSGARALLPEVKSALPQGMDLNKLIDLFMGILFISKCDFISAEKHLVRFSEGQSLIVRPLVGMVLLAARLVVEDGAVSDPKAVIGAVESVGRLGLEFYRSEMPDLENFKRDHPKIDQFITKILPALADAALDIFEDYEDGVEDEMSPQQEAMASKLAQSVPKGVARFAAEALAGTKDLEDQDWLTAEFEELRTLVSGLHDEVSTARDQTEDSFPLEILSVDEEGDGLLEDDLLDAYEVVVNLLRLYINKATSTGSKLWNFKQKLPKESQESEPADIRQIKTYLQSTTKELITVAQKIVVLLNQLEKRLLEFPDDDLRKIALIPALTIRQLSYLSSYTSLLKDIRGPSSNSDSIEFITWLRDWDPIFNLSDQISDDGLDEDAVKKRKNAEEEMMEKAKSLMEREFHRCRKALDSKLGIKDENDPKYAALVDGRDEKLSDLRNSIRAIDEWQKRNV